MRASGQVTIVEGFKRGKRVLTVRAPRRVLDLLTRTRADDVEFVFGLGESFSVCVKGLSKAIKEAKGVHRGGDHALSVAR